MERAVLGRGVLVLAVAVVSIALTDQSAFGETTECRANPAPPAAQGMHWYHRVDRTQNRHCWYLQAAGLQVRSHEIAAPSQPRPQIAAEQSLASPQEDTLQTSPSQLPTAESVLIAHNLTLGTPSAADFTVRWLDLPESVDLGAYDFAKPRSDYAVYDASPRSEEPMLSAQFVAPDTNSQLPHKSTNVVKFASVFIAGALSILFGRLLKLTGVLSRALTRPRLKSELDNGPAITLSELMCVLRRIDETFEAAETRVIRRHAA